MSILNTDPGREIMELIASEFFKAGLELEIMELARFAWLHRLLEKRNPQLDLTRIDEPKNIVIKHYVDSALAAGFIEVKGVMMDLGSGAGFPGLPMAILRPDWHLLLAEPRGRRLAFIEEAIDLLGLENVEIYPHKVSPAFDRDIDSLVARDFGSCADIIELAASILPPGGRLHLLKGPAVDLELKEASELPQWSDFGELRDHCYSLGPNHLVRRLITLVRGGRQNSVTKTSSLRIKEIASQVNPTYKTWLRLTDGRQIRKLGQSILSGRKSVPEALERYPQEVMALLAIRSQDYEHLSLPSHLAIYHLRPEIFPELDHFGTGPPLLIVRAPEPAPWDPEKPGDGVRLFVPFQDPVNVGTVIRTAAAMGVETVLLKQAANPYHPKALRASGPAIFAAQLLSGPSITELKSGPDFYALSPDGKDIRSLSPAPHPLNLVMGLEGPGLGKDWPLDRRLSIPMNPAIESLNAAAAAAVALALLTLGPIDS
jgi:16S rRNA (guanine527-N7)-methyltransferase